MKAAFLGAVAASLLLAACGGETPTASSRSTTTTTTTIPPAPIAPANFQYGSGTLVCQSGFCFSFSMALTNVGPGCATFVVADVSWYGADGAIPLPNTPMIGMGYPGGLSNVFFRPGTTIVVTSIGGFNDVRSAHTIYRANATWTNVRC